MIARTEIENNGNTVVIPFIDDYKANDGVSIHPSMFLCCFWHSIIIILSAILSKCDRK